MYGLRRDGWQPVSIRSLIGGLLICINGSEFGVRLFKSMICRFVCLFRENFGYLIVRR